MTKKLTKKQGFIYFIVVVLVSGLIGYNLGKNQPAEPTRPELEALKTIHNLQSIVHRAIVGSDWKTACRAQESVVDIMIALAMSPFFEQNFGLEFIDRAQDLEQMVCKRSKLEVQPYKGQST